ncbi:DUF4328 domain-containing protein [Streptomyces sp. NPDC058622]|uniref:DUF4328 domain-containing protein n=1 Tax=Streptomyces sp. NPDC058622 TaxID=3346562 RepID=UPI00364BBC7D
MVPPDAPQRRRTRAGPVRYGAGLGWAGLGWAIGAWFVPGGFLWMPYRIAVGMWSAGTRAAPSADPARVSVWPVNLWWGSFVGSVQLGQYAS